MDFGLVFPSGCDALNIVVLTACDVAGISPRHVVSRWSNFIVAGLSLQCAEARPMTYPYLGDAAAIPQVVIYVCSWVGSPEPP